jgi:hypothetical protein
MSVARTIRSIWRVGPREYWRQLQYIGDAKSGEHIGTDRYECPVLAPCFDVSAQQPLRTVSGTGITRT